MPKVEKRSVARRRDVYLFRLITIHKDKGITMKTSNFIYFIFTLLLITQVGFAKQAIIKIADENQTLNAKWEWALKTAQKEKLKDNFWIAYSFEKLMSRNSFVGCYSNRTKHLPGLQEMIDGKFEGVKRDFNSESSAFHTEGNFTINEGDSNSEKVLKDVALLFKVSLENSKGAIFKDIRISTTDIHFDLTGMPLIWLGNSVPNESIEFLNNFYTNSENFEIKKDIVAAVGMHPASSNAFKFLKSVLESKDEQKLREDAVFWIGQQDSPEALRLLKNTVYNDPSSEIRKKCVFSLHLLDLTEATDVLIDLAHKAESQKVRKDAIFWLSQKAGKKAVAAIEDAVFSEDTTELQKQAVFALSQLPRDEGIPRLIKVVKTHPNPKIRKNAIFWLGQTDDERALQVLVDLVKK